MATPYSVPVDGLRSDATHSLKDHPQKEAFLFACLNLCQQVMPDVSSLVEENAGKLSSHFQSLAGQSMEQGQAMQAMMAVMNQLEYEGSGVSLQEFIHLFQTSLSETMQKILFISQKAMAMVYAMDDTMQQLQQVESLLSRIRKITRQTKFLALNASIEAGRHSDISQGFGVVADEVRDVAHAIENLSDDMTDKITMIGQSIRHSYATLQDVATTDMSGHIHSREKLDVLMQSLMRQNQRTHQVMAESAAIADQIAHTISGMTMQLQFQDRTTQLLQNLCELLSGVQQLYTDIPAQSTEDTASGLLGRLKLGDLRQQLTRLLEAEGIDAGYHRTTSAPQKEEEDIELF